MSMVISKKKLPMGFTGKRELEKVAVGFTEILDDAL
jgi:hypothetical protein